MVQPTVRQIRKLQVRALDAGDYDLVRICRDAIVQPDDSDRKINALRCVAWVLSRVDSGPAAPSVKAGA